MLLDQYADILVSSLCRIRDTQREKILQAAHMASKAICADGMIYVFGCGHSHLLAEETFYRAGGLACVSPIVNEPLMLHESASLSSHLEKQQGLAQSILEGYTFGPWDTLICVSTSGINGVPVEVASEAKKRGLGVIGIASDAYLHQQPRNLTEKHLQEVCHVCIDNGAPHGDACLQPQGLKVKMTPVSTITGAYIVNSILAEATQLALDAGCDVPVYLSGNIPGGAAFNESLIARYKGRITCL